MIAVRQHAPALATGIESAARRLRVGDPRRADTEVGPLPSLADARSRRSAGRAGRGRRSGAPLRRRRRGARRRGRVPRTGRAARGPAGRGAAARARARPGARAQEAAGEERGDRARPRRARRHAVGLGGRPGSRRADRALAGRGDRLDQRARRRLAGAPVRLAKHVATRQLASQPTRLRSARWLPYDAALLRASVASARLRHGRESERWAALRSGALPLARTAARLGREALGRG